MPGGVGLSHALLGQRALVVGSAFGCFGVSEQPEHEQTVRGTTKSSFAVITNGRRLGPEAGGTGRASAQTRVAGPR